MSPPILYLGVKIEASLWTRTTDRDLQTPCKCPSRMKGFNYCSSCGQRLVSRQTRVEWDHAKIPPPVSELILKHRIPVSLQDDMSMFAEYARLYLNPTGDYILGYKVEGVHSDTLVNMSNLFTLLDKVSAAVETLLETTCVPTLLFTGGPLELR